MTFFVRGLPVKVKNKVLVIDSKGVDIMSKTMRDARQPKDDDENLHNHMIEYADDHHRDAENIENLRGEKYNLDEHIFHHGRDSEGNSYLVIEPRSERSEDRRDRKSRDAGRKLAIVDTVGTSNYGFAMLKSPAELNEINNKRWE